MRLLIVTNHFLPESFRVNDIAFDRTARGDSVTVLTAIPDYPEGRFHRGYGLFRKRVEDIGGVHVVRVPVIPRGGGGKVRMALHYASSIVCFFFYGLFQALFRRYDAVFVHDTSPAFISLPATRVSRFQKIPLYHWVLDMWPESLVAGGIEGGTAYSLILRMMKRIYRQDTKILITSHGFRGLLNERGVSEDKIVYLPNWSDDAIADASFEGLPEIPEGFVIMFAGNLGEAQNLENVLAAAKLTKDRKDIHWVFVGDGRKKLWMEDFVKDNALEDTVHLLGRFPIDKMAYFFGKADVMLVSLTSSLIFNLTLPAKVQAYMAAGKPILAMLSGEGKMIIEDAHCGWTVDPDDIDGMVAKVLEVASLSSEEIGALGRSSRAYYEAHFTKDICMNILDNVLKERNLE